MKINIKAFTLIELVIGITISMLLMVSIGVFVSNGISSIILQEKVVDDNKKLSSDFLFFQKTILNSKKYITKSGTGFLIKNKRNLNKGGYSYLGVKEFNNFYYCGTGEIDTTKHLFESKFIPYEEIGEDINDDFLAILTSETTNYRSDVLKHQIIKKSNNSIKIGKNFFGNKFSDGSAGTGIFLNSPTGIIDVDGKIIFSDTLNDRILFLSGGLVYKLLDEEDGLNEPTGLAYDNINKILYIANSSKGEILKFSSKNYPSNPNLEINFNPENNFSANKIKIELLNTTNSLTNPDSKNDFIFTNLTKKSNDFVKTENQKINYYFINNYISEQARIECNLKSNGDIVINSNDKPIYCTNNGTGSIANYGTNNYISGNDYKIDVSDIGGVLMDKKHYFINLQLLEDNSIKFEKKFSYFTQGDNSIFTKDDNILEVFSGGLEYPTGLKIIGGKLKVNIFKTREIKTFNFDGTIDSIDTTTLKNFTALNFKKYKPTFVFSNPIKDLEINYDINKILNLNLEYYKYFNCYNIDNKINRNMIFKKSYK